MRAARDSLGSTPEAADQRNGSISLEVNGQPAGTVEIPLMMMISRFNSSTTTGPPRSRRGRQPTGLSHRTAAFQALSQLTPGAAVGIPSAAAASANPLS